MRATLIVTFAALLAACGGGGGSSPAGGLSPPAPQPPPPPAATAGLARTACGDYQGTDRGSTWSFLGIRFAAAPTGARRWRSPEPPTCPTAIVAANVYAAKCPQLDRTTGAPEGDEDCLAVNVFTPKTSLAAGRAPVMVFIHGGGRRCLPALEVAGSPAGRAAADRQRLRRVGALSAERRWHVPAGDTDQAD
jgi:hypothetical protein